VKVAQEYQIVYALELDENGRSVGELETVEGQMNIYDTVAFGPRVPIFNLAGRYTGEVRPTDNWGPWRGTALGRPCSEYAWRTGPHALAQRR
jgi:hypothetical protein